MRANRLLISALAVALLQVGLLAWMVIGRAAILRDGREVLLEVVPYDPRDLLRGDYVQLSYRISQIPASKIVNASQDGWLDDQVIYVRLQRPSSGAWSAISASLGTAFATPPTDGQVDIRGTATSRWSPEPDGIVSIDYGIERFYLPEGAGKPIEDRMRERIDAPSGEGTANAHTYAVVAAVAADGTAQIKRLEEDGEVLFEEPIY